MRSFRRDGLTFDVRDSGPVDGEPIVLLHGWPGGAPTWDDVAPLLAAQGYRTLALDQRGYSPGARPSRVRAYVVDELVGDVLALLDAADLESAHVVGHDWGGVVTWALAAAAPGRVASITVLSTPHPAAMQQALRSLDQIRRSSYMVLFQLPVLPERLLLARGGRRLQRALQRTGLAAEIAAGYVRRQVEPGALAAALRWYRALPFSRTDLSAEITVPTLYVWSSGDVALGRQAAALTADHVTGPYRFEELDGVSHWIPEEAPEQTAELVAAHVARHPRSGREEPVVPA